MPFSSEETSLVVLVPEAEWLVRDLREHCDPSAARGVEAHVSLLYPFAQPDRINHELLEGLEKIFWAIPSFMANFSGVCGFPDVVYLAPDDLTPFDAITHAITQGFPEWPHYAGDFENPTPHMTIAQERSGADLDKVARELISRIDSAGGVASTVDAAHLLEKRDDEWSVHTRFPFGG